MKKLLFCLVAFLLPMLGAQAQTVTVTPSVTNFSPAGGNVTFTVNMTYTGTQSALGLGVAQAPDGWVYVSTGGTNVPQVAPEAGSTNSFDFTYFTIPANAASFTFTVSYPAGLTANQVFSGIVGIFRPTGGQVQQIAVPNVVVNAPPTPPSITVAAAVAPVTVGSTASFTVQVGGNPTPTVVWQKDSGSGFTNLTNGGRISGANTLNLQITGVLSADAGAYRAVASNGNNPDATSNVTLTVNKASQTITFPDLPTGKIFGNPPFQLNATASSNLTVTYVSMNTNVATVSGDIVTIVGAGSAEIVASQTGNADYNAAVNVSRTLSVGKATATFVVSPPPSTIYDGTPKPITVVTTPPGLTVTTTYNGSTTPPINAGSYSVVSTVVDDNYAGSTSGNLLISKASQTIDFTAIPTKTFGDANFDLVAVASSGLPVVFSSGTTSVATVSGSTVTILSGGSSVFSATQAGNGNYLPATQAQRTLNVDKANATVTLGSLSHVYNGSVKGATATTNPANLSVSFTYEGTATSTTAPTNAGTYPVTGTISDNRYQGSATGTLEIAKAPQTIAFAPLPSRPFNDPDFTLTATATSGLPVSYASSAPGVATVNGNVVDLIATGNTTITASQAGNDNYLPAASVDQPLTVLNAGQTITFAALADRTFGVAPFELSAESRATIGNAPTGLTVAFASSNLQVATISGTTVTVVGAGETTITATQPGNSNFASAAPVERLLKVNKATATVTLGNLAATYNGTPRAATATTNPQGLTVNFTYNGSATAPTNVGTYPVVATIDSANYVGTANGNLVIAKGPQTITFEALPARLINGGTFTLVATASSNLAVTYTSSNPGVASVNGSVVTILAVGETTITAQQAGDTNYLAATSVPQLQVINPLAPIIGIPSTTATAIIGSSFLYGPVTVNALSAPRTFSATGLPAGLSVNATNGNISGIPAVSATPGSYPITLTATNASGFDSKTLTLTLQAPVPVIQSPAAAAGVAGTSFTYTAQATNATSYSATGLPAGLSVNTATGAITGTTTLVGTFAVNLTATNSTGSVTLPLVLTFALPPDAPVYAGPVNPSGTVGTAFSFTPNFGTSANATTFAITSGSLPNGLVISSTTGAITGTPTQVGAFPITLTATRSGISVGAQLTVTINSAATAPSVTFPNGSTVAATVGAAFPTFSVAATPATGASFAAVGLPNGLAINATTGAITGTPTAPGTSNVQINASNTAGQGPTAVVIITVNPHPSAPVLTSAPVVQGVVNQPLNYALAASPAGTTTYALTGTLPAGLSLSSGTVSGTPTAAGTAIVFFTGSNTNGAGLALEVTFVIAPPSTAPVVTSNGTASGQVGQPFSYNITATNSPTSFNAANLPAGLTVNTGTGLISGVPSVSTLPGQPIGATVGASNANGGNVKPLLITIAPAPATPVITSAASGSGRVGTAFSYQVTATESANSFAAMDLPAGLALNPGTGAITGSPLAAGQFTVTLRAGNAAGLGAPAFLALVIAPPLTAPAITSAPSATGQVGVAFATYQIAASQGPITSYAYTGMLPLGLALNSTTGTITGTPAEPGLYIVNLTATSAGGTSLPQPLTITINPAVGVPVITSSNAATATVGTAFNYTITATNVGSGPPYAPSVTLDAVNLPTGLAVNPSTGVIQGVPSTVGSSVASLVGTNAAGVGPIRALTINVQPALAAPVVSSGGAANAQVGVPFSYQIAATNNPTSFELLNAPLWMTFNGATGLISGTPTTPGTIQLAVAASNTAGGSSPKVVTLAIAPAPNTPAITSSLSAFGTVGTAFGGYQITAAPAATAYLAAGLPAGLSLNPATGAISGTPTISGTFQVTLTASNANGLGSPVVLVLTINPSLQLLP